MKTIKRIIAVLLLIITIMVVGYLVFTGSRLTNLREEQNTEVTYEIEESVER